jgi:hypothetical protein
MTVSVRVLAARIPASIDGGEWRSEYPDVQAMLELCSTLDLPTIGYAPDWDFELARLAVLRLGGVIVEADPIMADAPESAEY